MVVAVFAACGGQEVIPPGQPHYDDLTLTGGSIDKVDLLFAIDNSQSMAEKQDLLSAAVPDLIGRLLVPNCIDWSQGTPKVIARGADGLCPDPSREEFPAVHDLHVGIVTSSLGGGGAEQTGGKPVCPPNALEPRFQKFNAHNDDKGHLINRIRPTAANSTGIEDTVADAVALDGQGGGFLAWLPKVDKNVSKTAPNVPAISPDATPSSALAEGQTRLVLDFQDLVKGTGEFGCGLEAQLESWYRFLIQPDPYDSIVIQPDPNGGPATATLVGVDTTILKQRHDFLRPDSLVAIVMLTDEEDSWSDPLAVGGRGWVTRASEFPGSPTKLMPRGTSACNVPTDPNNPTATGPNDPNCTSCAFAGNMANGQPIAGDPNCTLNCGPNCAGYYTDKEDSLNTRYVNDMKRRFGLDPQFPISRYVSGLRSAKVPNRDGEHPNGKGTYAGKANCTNPLFAASLPTDPQSDLCNLPLGPRTSDLVYFSLIGGVPWQLLYTGAGFKTALGQQDWQSILGKDPENFDLTGIDPHMIQSHLPRNAKNQSAIPYLQNPLPNDPTSSDTADPYNGREWDTSLSPFGLDHQFACTFALPKPKECADPANVGSCDCVQNAKNPGGPPLCAPGASGNSLQIRGKSYPTIRELRVAKALGSQAIVGSICPKEPKDMTSPDYGYRPILANIVDRLKNVLTGSCLPKPLQPNADGKVSCDIVEALFANGQGQTNTCDEKLGLAQPDSVMLHAFNAKRCADAKGTGDAGPGGAACAHPEDPELVARELGPVCVLQQFATPAGTTCEANPSPGWCVVSGPPARGCGQAIQFSSTAIPHTGTKLHWVCPTPF
jgi:hypothetical protein